MIKDPIENLAIIIGAMKSGTTSLHNYIGAHPEVSASFPKEPGFFLRDERTSAALDAYREILLGKKVKLDAETRIYLESSTNYSKCHVYSDVPERISKIAPHTRFVYLLRNPYKRILSHYAHNVRCGRESRPFQEALSTDGESNHYVSTSCYFFQLSRYLKRFDPSRFLLITLEELSQAPIPTMKRVFKHLGVNDQFSDPLFDQIFHKSPTKVSTEYALPETRPKLYSELSVNARGRVMDAIKTDVHELEKLSGMTFSAWLLE